MKGPKVEESKFLLIFNTAYHPGLAIDAESPESAEVKRRQGGLAAKSAATFAIWYRLY
jgi:hypothetical protein